MKFCTRCGANIEGLVRHCDCCGAPIVLQDELVFWNTFMTQASGDLAFWTNQLFQKVISRTHFSHFDNLSKIKFELYCYPTEIITSENLKSRVYHSKTKKEFRVRIVMNYGEYTLATPQKRKTLVADSIVQGIYLIKNKLPKSEISVLHFLCDFEEQINHAALE